MQLLQTQVAIQSSIQHLNEMEPERLPEQTLNSRPRGKRHIGRPRTRWNRRT